MIYWEENQIAFCRSTDFLKEENEVAKISKNQIMEVFIEGFIVHLELFLFNL